MTERWRKKLEGIDQVAPRDDVYERAKAGPTLPESRSPMQRTSTRVATAIVAFVVFALAISLFAIPTLRLGGEAQSPTIGGQLQPLWPWSSTAAVEAWRADPQPIGTASVEHFSAPDEVAAAFGRQIFGPGTEVWAHEEGTPPAPIACAVEAQGLGPSLPSSAASAINPYCSIGYPSGSSETILPHAPTSAEPAFRTFDLSVCPPNAACNWSFPGPPNISVTVYRPIGVDGPWAVLEAASAYMDLSISAGTSLEDGSTVSGSGMVFDGFRASLGYRSMSDSCPASGTTTPFERVPAGAGTDHGESGVTLGSYSQARLDIHLPAESASCADQPGYVFIVLTDGSFDAVDPLAGIPEDTRLLAFVAVPVSLSFPAARETTSPSPTAVSVAWTTYTDPLGWTIDVPTTWMTKKIDGSDANTTYAGAAFGSATLEQDPGGPIAIGVASGEMALLLYRSTCVTCPGPGPRLSDDSDLPLALSAMDTVDGGYLLAFRADGIPFTLQIRLGSNDPTAEQLAILQRMVSSIHFEPWHIGEQRDGWTALNPIDQDPLSWRIAMISWQSCNSRGCYVLTSGEPTGQYLLGPIKPCGEGENMTADAPNATDYVIVLECPDGSTQRWTRTGTPAPTNSTGYDAQLERHPVVKAWDGSLLANVDETIG